jgi:hypothetical protein
MDEYRFAIINGFDRSGTTLIAKVLATHPQVELIFQPFNRTVVHETQWAEWEPEVRCPELEAFLDSLLSGRLDRSFLKSEWCANQSTTLEPQAGKLHVIKSTKLHFKSRWLRSRYPQMPLFGIYRDPRGVLCSLVRNGFHVSWYGARAFAGVSRFLETRPDLDAMYGRFLRDARDDVEKMAVVIAVRTRVMGESLDPSRWLVYEEVLKDPNGELNGFLARFGLSEMRFSSALRRDWNVVGERFKAADLWRSRFGRDELERLEPILFSHPSRFVPSSERV